MYPTKLYDYTQNGKILKQKITLVEKNQGGVCPPYFILASIKAFCFFPKYRMELSKM